jgi:hypothetical protein
MEGVTIEDGLFQRDLKDRGENRMTLEKLMTLVPSLA